jgi:hypothetical protein
MFKIRQAISSDLHKIYALYKKVATETSGLARSGDEIIIDYVQNFMENSSHTGIELVVDNPANSNQIIAEIHCYKLIPKTFNHVLSELTIAVDPDDQGKGIDRQNDLHAPAGFYNEEQARCSESGINFKGV